jgi:hypothetical protein
MTVATRTFQVALPITLEDTGVSQTIAVIHWHRLDIFEKQERSAEPLGPLVVRTYGKLTADGKSRFLSQVCVAWRAGQLKAQSLTKPLVVPRRLLILPKPPLTDRLT